MPANAVFWTGIPSAFTARENISACVGTLLVPGAMCVIATTSDGVFTASWMTRDRNPKAYLTFTFSNHLWNQRPQVDFPGKHTGHLLGNIFKIIPSLEKGKEVGARRGRSPAPI